MEGNMDNGDVPEAFQCPITGEVFVDPVVANDGHTYERSAIVKWLQVNTTSPITREAMTNKDLVPNFIVRKLQEEWANLGTQRVTADVRAAKPASEIPFAEVQLGLGPLGKGDRKSAQQGKWRKLSVAVVSTVAPYQGLQQEAALCSLLVRHPHVVALYGVTRDEEQRPHLVAELAPYGSLKHLLSKLHDQGVLLSPMTILAMAQQVCEALQALHHVGVAHRALCASNVLVCERFDPEAPTDILLKVAGLSWAVETSALSIEHPLPTGLERCMAPEALERNKWNEKTDMWAFGVLLWEVATLGMTPYHSMGVFANDAELKEGICSGRLQLPCPATIPSLLYELFALCWVLDPKDRPTFRAMRRNIQELAVRLEVSRALNVASSRLMAPYRGDGAVDRLAAGYDGLGVLNGRHIEELAISPTKSAQSPGKGSDWFDIHMLQRKKDFVGLSQAMRLGDPHMRVRAAAAVDQMCNNVERENFALCEKANVATAVVEMARNGNAAQVEAAALCMRSLARDTSNQLALAKAGAIEALIVFLRTGSDKEQIGAAMALANISLHTENKKRVADAKGIAALVEVAKTGSPLAQAKVAGALQNLTVDDNNKVVMAQVKGGIESMIELVRIGTEEAQQKAAATLWNLGRNAENSPTIGRLGGIGMLVGLLSHGSDEGKANAAGAIWTLTVNNANNMEKVTRAGGVEALVHLSKHGCKESKAKASAALYNLARDPKNSLVQKDIRDTYPN